MEITDFISKIETEIEELKPGTLTPESDLRKTDVWTSMHALILIALIDAEYNVTITGEDLRNANSIEALFTLVKNRM